MSLARFFSSFSSFSYSFYGSLAYIFSYYCSSDNSAGLACYLAENSKLTRIVFYPVINDYANDKAKAYAKGIDFKVNGEFVKDLESWFSLSFMSTQEDIYNDKINIKDVSGIDSAIIYPGYIPRPTDQRFNFSVFFPATYYILRIQGRHWRFQVRISSKSTNLSESCHLFTLKSCYTF